MRIAWVTPLVQRSAIGRFSASVTAELANRGHQVRIVRSESVFDPGEPVHPTDLEVIHFEQIDPKVLNAESDLVVVNIGDNYLFHAGVFPQLDAASCLGVFHDYYLINLFNGWAAAGRATAQAYRDEIVATYGLAAGDLAEDARAGVLALESIARTLPMTEWIARRCAGAMAHAAFYADRLRSVCTGPVGVAHLATSPRGVASLPARTRDEVIVTTVGVMNANKCADAMIEAIAASPLLRRRVRYHLVGPISSQEQARLEGLARQGGYDGLSILGAVDDPTLEHELAEADIIVCLRKPVLEGASASAIEGLLSGRPVIVADAGFYAELPDALVFKTPADVPLPALTRHLEILVGDEALRRKVGAAARAWASDHFSTTRYVDAMEALIRETVDEIPFLAVGSQIGDELSGFGLTAGDISVARIAGMIEAMWPKLRANA